MPDVTPPASDAVMLGCRVRVRDTEGEDEYTLVDPRSTDPARGLISALCPVGRALLGRGRGEEVRVHTTGGIRLLTVVDITAPARPSAVTGQTCAQ